MALFLRQALPSSSAWLLISALFLSGPAGRAAAQEPGRGGARPGVPGPTTPAGAPGTPFGFRGNLFNPYSMPGGGTDGGMYSHDMPGSFYSPYGTPPNGYGSLQNREKACKPRDPANVLDIFGVPHDGDRLRWPVGLKVLPPGEQTGVLLAQIDSLALLAARETVRERGVNPVVLERARRSVEKLKRLFHEKGDALPVAQETRDEARRFLRDLGAGLELFGSPEMKTYPTSATTPREKE